MKKVDLTLRGLAKSVTEIEAQATVVLDCAPELRDAARRSLESKKIAQHMLLKAWLVKEGIL